MVEEYDDEETLDEKTMGSTFFAIGIGGCGGNLIDSILLRQRGMSDPQSLIWEQWVHDAAILNTNSNELANTYYATEYADLGDKIDVAYEYVVGNGQGSGTDPMIGRQKMQNEIENHDIFSGYYPKLEGLHVTENVMVLHSAVKGTGTGAAPLLTKQLKEGPLKDGTVFHFTVLPDGSESSIHSLQVMNGLYGMIEATKYADAVIVVDNYSLKNIEVTVNIDEYNQWKHGFKDQNKTAVAFLEGFAVNTLYSDASNERVTYSDGFDIGDVINPVRRWHDLEDGLAPILAPALGESNLELTSEDDIQTLLLSTRTEGKLHDFSPETAWGATLVFYGNKNWIDTIRDLWQQHEEPFRDDIGFDSADTERQRPIHTYFTGVEEMENVRLLILYWNPELEVLQSGRNVLEELGSHESPLIKAIEENESHLNSLLDNLGYRDSESKDGNE